MFSYRSCLLIAIFIAINTNCSVVELLPKNDFRRSADSLFITRLVVLVRWGAVSTLAIWSASRLRNANWTTWFIPVLLLTIVAVTSRFDFYVNFPWNGWGTQWEWLSDNTELGISIFWNHFVGHFLVAIIVSLCVFQICNITLVPRTGFVIEDRRISTKSLMFLTAMIAIYLALNNADRWNTLQEYPSELKADFAMRIDRVDLEHGVVIPVQCLQMVNTFAFAICATLFAGNRVLRLTGVSTIATLLCIRVALSLYSNLVAVPQLVSEGTMLPTLVPTFGQLFAMDLAHVLLPLFSSWILQSTGYRWLCGGVSVKEGTLQDGTALNMDEQSDIHEAADRPL